MQELLHIWFNIYHYLWNIGVPGNLLASVIWVPIAAICITLWAKAKIVSPMIKRHEEQKLHEKKMLLSQQKIHDKLGTGHNVFDESIEDATPGDRKV